MAKLREGNKVEIIATGQTVFVIGYLKIGNDERVKCNWWEGSKPMEGYFNENELKLIETEKSTFVSPRL